MALAVSVTLKRTVSASFSRVTLPASTMPPTRKALSLGTSLAATCVGVKKNTRFDWKAFSTRKAASPRAASPAAIHAARLVLGFKVALLVDAGERPAAAGQQPAELDDDGRGGRGVGHEQEVAMAHESRGK